MHRRARRRRRRREYDNARYGYSIAIPAAFGPAREAENGDGIRLEAAGGHAKLLVWGETLLDGSFTSEVASRIGDEEDGGFEAAQKEFDPIVKALEGFKAAAC